MLIQGADAIDGPYAAPEEAGALIQGNGIWGRIEGGYNSIEPRYSSSGLAFDLDAFRMQAGVDGILMENEKGKLTGSISAHYVHGKTKTTWMNDVDGYGNGEISTDGYGFGASLTWFGDNGFYLDNQVQFTWYNSDLGANPGHSLIESNDGFGYALSTEAGKQITIDQNWSLTPQIQLVYSNVDFESFADTFGSIIKMDRNDSLQGRIGLSLGRQNSWYDSSTMIRRSYFYGISNLYYEFLEGTKVNVSEVSFATQNDRFWGGIGFGGSYNWDDDKYSVYGEGLVDTSLNNFGDSYSFKGNLGFRLKW